MSYEQILFEVDDPVAIITLNRPEALNAWTAQMANEVRDAVGRAERDPHVVGIVLTGAGKGFCAGADMKGLAAASGADGSGTSGAPDVVSPRDETPVPGDPSAGEDLRGTYTYFMSVPKPVVAAINGPVAGMGVPIALACDLRFMNQDAVLTTSFAQRGLVAEWGLSWLLSRLAGPSHALDLLFTARKVKGDEAARIGLVNRALPADEVLPAAVDYIRDLAIGSSPASLAAMKLQVWRDLNQSFGRAHEDGLALMKESFNRPDFAEGVKSYLERRPPDFPRVAR
jgi:enoyl-CoA hydratase/carnithine racemase